MVTEEKSERTMRKRGEEKAGGHEDPVPVATLQ